MCREGVSGCLVGFKNGIVESLKEFGESGATVVAEAPMHR
jgi:hypothetical protein